MIRWGGRIAGGRRGWLLAAPLLLLCALLVAWRQPWRAGADPPRPLATPEASPPPATATAARMPDRVALPPTAPIALSPAATPGPAIPTRPGGIPSAAGSLIYLGRSGDTAGIIAANADGSARRLIAPGLYVALAWSPDGGRFAALGGDGYEQIALFAADGRPLARYPVPAGTQCDLRWSPDGNYVVCSPTYPFLGRERAAVLIADEAGLREAVVPPVVRTAFLGWPAPGVLGLLGLPEEWPYAASEVWLVDLAVGEVRRLIQGDFWPLGWSADRTALLALGGRQPRGGLIQPGEPVFTELIAVDLATGQRRVVERAFNLARPTVGVNPITRAWFSYATLSPGGGQLALWIARESPPGSPTVAQAATAPSLVMLILRDSGDLATVTAALSDATLGVNQSWSPDGLRLAIVRHSGPTGGLTLAITSTSGGGLQPFRMDGRGETDVVWSADSRWFAYAAPEGLAVAGIGGPDIALLDPDGRAPAWRPAPR